MGTIDDKWREIPWIGAPVDAGAGSEEMATGGGGLVISRTAPSSAPAQEVGAGATATVVPATGSQLGNSPAPDGPRSAIVSPLYRCNDSPE